MERSLIRANLVLYVDGPAGPPVKWPAPTDFFGEGSRVGFGPDGLLFQSPRVDANGLADEVHCSAERIAICCTSAVDIPPLFKKVWEILQSSPGTAPRSICFNAEYEWSGLDLDTEEWLAASFMKEEPFKGRSVRCEKIHFEVSLEDGEWLGAHKIFLEPRFNKKNSLYGMAIQQLRPVLEDIDKQVEAVVSFASDAASTLIEPYLPFEQ